MLAEALRTELRRRKEPLIGIERATGISRDSISRFLRGKTLHLDVADRLAAYFGIQIVLPTLEAAQHRGATMDRSLLVVHSTQNYG